MVAPVYNPQSCWKCNVCKTQVVADGPAYVIQSVRCPRCGIVLYFSQGPTVGALPQTLHELVLDSGPLSTGDAIRTAHSVANQLRLFYVRRRVAFKDLAPWRIVIWSTSHVNLIPPAGQPASLLDEGSIALHEKYKRPMADYLAPELFRSGSPVDKRSDIYALGCIVFFLLTGVSPYHGQRVLEQINAKLAGAVPTDRWDRSQPRLAAVLRQMTSASPDSRYRDIDETISALAAIQKVY